jgi:hypothetical protein
MRTIDIVKGKPIENWLKEKPDNVLEAVFAAQGKDYNIYLADARELTDKNAGTPIHGHIRFDLPEGDYEFRSYSPETGLYSPAIKIKGSRNLEFAVPEIHGDIVLRITKT